MGMVGSVAMGLQWKGRSRGSVCWVGLVSGCWVLPWKGRGSKSVDRCFEKGVVGSCRRKEEAEDRSVRSCRGKEMAENRYFIFVWEEGNGRVSKESVKREGFRMGGR